MLDFVCLANPAQGCRTAYRSGRELARKVQAESLSRIIRAMEKKSTAKPCTSDRTQRKYCGHYNERTGICSNPSTTHAPPRADADEGKQTDRS